MRYVVFVGLIVLLFLLQSYTINESFDTITKIKRDNAIQNTVTASSAKTALANDISLTRPLYNEDLNMIINNLWNENRITDVNIIKQLRDVNVQDTPYTLDKLINSNLLAAKIITEVLITNVYGVNVNIIDKKETVLAELHKENNLIEIELINNMFVPNNGDFTIKSLINSGKIKESLIMARVLGIILGINGIYKTTVIINDMQEEIIKKLTGVGRINDIKLINNIYITYINNQTARITIKDLIDIGKTNEAAIIADILNIGGFYDTSGTETEEQIILREEKEEDLKEKTNYRNAVDNYNVEYHNSPEELAKGQGISLTNNIVWVFDTKSNKKIAMNVPSIQNSATYHKPGEYKYGASSYVPSYVESVLLSKQTNLFNRTTTDLMPVFNYYDINNPSDNYLTHIFRK